jgi:hypothetical protein
MTTRFLTVSLTISMTGLMLAAAPARALAQGWMPAAAAYANDDYRTSYADAQRTAYDNGFRSGLKRGAQAARDRRPLDIERERDYRSADDGYNRSLGDRNRYRDTFRGGFAQGYREGYNGDGRFTNGDGRFANGNGRFANRPYTGTASFGARQNGLSDGYKKGLDDANDRKVPDVSRQKWYRNGDHDYDSRYGSKETYRLEYRRGFEEGYNRAYREARRYR